MLTVSPRTEDEKAREFPNGKWKVVGYISTPNRTGSHDGEFFSMVFPDVIEAYGLCRRRGWEYEVKWS